MIVALRAWEPNYGVFYCILVTKKCSHHLPVWELDCNISEISRVHVWQPNRIHLSLIYRLLFFNFLKCAIFQWFIVTINCKCIMICCKSPRQRNIIGFVSRTAVTNPVWLSYNTALYAYHHCVTAQSHRICVSAATALRLNPWWRHQMETFSVLLTLCAWNSPVTGEFPSQRPVTQSFDVLFDLHLIKRLGKQCWGWWFETPSRSLWRHCYVFAVSGRTKIASQCCRWVYIIAFVRMYSKCPANALWIYSKSIATVMQTITFLQSCCVTRATSANAQQSHSACSTNTQRQKCKWTQLLEQ